MARLRFAPYRASQAIAPGAAGRANFDTSAGAALSQLGRAVGGVGDTFAAIADRERVRQEGLENFQAQNDWNSMDLRLAQEREEMLETYDGTTGEGFTRDFIANHFQPARQEFMEKLPPRLQEKYAVLLSDDPEQPGEAYVGHEIKAATNEKALRTTYYDKEVGLTQERLASAIQTMPVATREQYENFQVQGEQLIDAATDMPKAWREAKKTEWRKMSAVAFMNKLMGEGRSQDVLRWLGVDPRQLNPTVRNSLLERAVIAQESGGDPTAESPKGASGLMQVMPETGREIAKELKDPNFPHSTPGGVDDIKTYLKDPAVSIRYGRHYLNKQLQAFNGDVEAALIAYNGGPARAKAWLAAGRDDRVIPKETRKYYKEVLRRTTALPSYNAEGKPVYGTGKTESDAAVADLDYGTRQKYIAAAEKAVLDSTSSLTPVAKVRLQADMDRELALYRNTGEGSEDFNPAQIVQSLGEDDFIKWEEKRQTNQAMYLAESRVVQLRPEDMDPYLNELKPNPDDPLYPRQQKVFDAVEREIERVRRLRTRSPAEAVLEIPELEATRRQLEGQERQKPEDMQAFIAAMIARQREVGVAPVDIEFIPENWALGFGAYLTTNIPSIEDLRPHMEANKLQSAYRTNLGLIYQQMERTFGPYTDEVITQSVQTYLGMDRDNAEMIEALMQQIARKGMSPDAFLDYAAGTREAESERIGPRGEPVINGSRDPVEIERRRREQEREAAP